jgi:hypothetical protein
MTLDIVGTRNSVAQVAKSRPPITAFTREPRAGALHHSISASAEWRAFERPICTSVGSTGLAAPLTTEYGRRSEGLFPEMSYRLRRIHRIAIICYRQAVRHTRGLVRLGL